MKKLAQNSTLAKLRLHGNRCGKVETVTDFIFLDSNITWVVAEAMKLEDTFSSEAKL